MQTSDVIFMSKKINGIVAWLKDWFYDKNDVDGFLNNKLNTTDLSLQLLNINGLNSSNSIPNNANLNNYGDAGYYTNSNATGITNSPLNSNVRFVLKVVKFSSSSSHIMQILTTFPSGTSTLPEMYIRKGSIQSEPPHKWTTWQKINMTTI